MSSIYVIHLLLLCLSMHACKCNARLLAFLDHESVSEAYRSVEDVGKASRLSETSKSSMEPTISVEYQTQVEADKNAEHGNEPASGHDIITLSSQIYQPTWIKMKGFKRQKVRALLGSGGTNDMEEDKVSKEDETVEDVGVMDYAQPHRKPPIHNAKP